MSGTLHYSDAVHKEVQRLHELTIDHELSGKRHYSRIQIDELSKKILNMLLEDNAGLTGLTARKASMAAELATS